MTAILKSRQNILNVLSASALEKVGQFWFLVGDDSYDLYRLDDKLEVVGKTVLKKNSIQEGREAKSVKLDLEAMTSVEWKGRTELLLFGSGSKRLIRDNFFRVDVTHPTQPKLISVCALTPLYDTLRSSPVFVGTQKLNLEAAASTCTSLLLLQRGNISGVNGYAEFELSSFMTWVEGGGLGPTPTPTCLGSVTLPQIGGRSAGFSAACLISPSTSSPRLLFSASVEDTPDEIQDGPCLGSFIGVLSKSSSSGQLHSTQIWSVEWASPVTQEGQVVPVKIEGVWADSLSAEGGKVFAVTDADGDPSEWLLIHLTL